MCDLASNKKLHYQRILPNQMEFALVLRQASLDGCLRRLSEGQGEAPLGTPITLRVATDNLVLTQH